MNYEQLEQPNLSVVGQDGYCLLYVSEVFGVPEFYDTAAIAWQNTQYPHAGETPPSNISVPIWFSWETEGHVAVWHNGTIYSTSAVGDKTFPSIQALVDFIGEGIEYLGWSEDINKVRVVEGVPMDTVTQQDLDNLSGDLLPGYPTIQGYVGATFHDFIYGLVQTDEFKANLAKLQAATQTPIPLAPSLYEVK